MISEEFGDIYFSKEDGLAETRHTFLAGNNLPEAWAGRARFCICETGFGTGLNILAAWKLFEETADEGQRLDFISIEKFPLDVPQIREALSPWADELGGYLERLLAVYPMRVRGFHRLELAGNVSLTLVFDDVNRALPELDARVDAWFLDGFAPAKNPDMWQPALYREMARLSAHGAGVATFTAAGDVRRGLAEAGFDVEKRKGYGRKRDMVVARYNGGQGGAPAATAAVPKKVAVVGAGIAGLSAAWHLMRAGCDVTVYEAEAQAGTKASGNMRGIVNPKLTAQATPQSDYYTAGYAYALRFLRGFDDIGFAPYGSLHLQINDDKARRFGAYCDNLGWHASHMRLLQAAEAADVAGVPIGVECLYYPDAAAVSPERLCRRLAGAMDMRVLAPVHDIEALGADAVVLANAADVKSFFDLPVGRVRGQVSMVVPNAVSRRLGCTLSYGGYITPLMDNGLHMCGATFQPWGQAPEVLEEDHTHNLLRLADAVPALDGGLSAAGGRVGFRASSRDRLPIIGMHNGVFLSVAHGSHGIISGLMAGAVASAALCGGPLPVAKSALHALAAARFDKG